MKSVQPIPAGDSSTHRPCEFEPLQASQVSAASQSALQRLLSAERASSEWFSHSFLKQVQLKQLEASLAQVRTSYGAFLRVEVTKNACYAVFERGQTETDVITDQSGQITFLRLAPFIGLAVNLEEALSNLIPDTDDVAYLVLEGSTPIAEYQADRPMAVGSSFKLAVLAALMDRIEQDCLAWADVLMLNRSSKSLPSGILHEWPDRFPLTIGTYAALMISASDNTATDMLLRLLGRSEVEVYAENSRPILTTREVFALRSKGASILRETYRRADEGRRRSLLSEIAKLPEPKAEDLDVSDASVPVGYEFSVRELCGLIARVQELEIMSINPGFSTSRWERVAYKGGSDIGALNFTSYLQARTGQIYAVSVTWNSSAGAIDEIRTQAAYGALLAQLALRAGV